MSLPLQINTTIEDQWRFLVVLFISGIVLYSITLNVGFFSDDFGFNEEIFQHNWGAFGRNFGDKFFIPISHFFGFILYKVTFGSALLMHLAQVIVHILVSFQLYLLIKELGAKVGHTSKAISIGSLSAIIFLVHPFQTEAVVWLAAKSYGYGLLFSLLSIRYLFKSTHLHLLISLTFLFFAIHCKESAYFIPLTAMTICLMIQMKIKKNWLIGWSVVIVCSLVMRYLVLGEFIGGYGADVHSNFHPLILLIVLMSYGFKFLSLIRINNEFLFYGWLLIILPFIIATGYSFVRSQSIKCFLQWSLVVISLLIPILNLEISSLESISTDRYSYFVLAAISFGMAFVFVNVLSRSSKVLIPLILLFFIMFNVHYQCHWIGSAEVRDNYLSEVKSNVAQGENVIIVNIPDRAFGTYCLKNATEDYMRTEGIACNLEFYVPQNMTKDVQGIAMIRSCIDCPIWFRNYPELSIAGRYIYNEDWLTTFDKVLIYQEGKLIRITEDYLKSVPLQSE